MCTREGEEAGHTRGIEPPPDPEPTSFTVLAVFLDTWTPGYLGTGTAEASGKWAPIPTTPVLRVEEQNRVWVEGTCPRPMPIPPPQPGGPEVTAKQSKLSQLTETKHEQKKKTPRRAKPK